MSGPRGQQEPGQQSAETPWWQQVSRRTPSPPSYPAEPQRPPYQQPAYPPVQQPAQQAGRPGPYYPPQYAQQPAAQPKHLMRWLLIAGGLLVGAIAAVVAVLGLLAVGAFGRQVLNVSKAQEAVKQVITDPITGYGIANVTDVRCNNGRNPIAKKGASFTCDVTVDGKKHQVRAVFIDDNGTYEVDRPR
jgi:hypothetical protein